MVVMFILSCLKLTAGIDNNNNKTSTTRINEGASTSGIKNFSKCKINEGASTSCIRYPSYESLVNVKMTASELELQRKRSIYAEKYEIHTFVDKLVNSIASNIHNRNTENQPDLHEISESM